MLRRLCLGLLMGIITGLCGRMINFSIDNLFNHTQKLFTGHAMLVMPIIGGVVLGLYKKYSSPNNPSGFDVAMVREELRCIKSYLMKPVYVLVNIIALFISLISGWSVGKQGPMVYLGAAIGSFFAYNKERNDEERKVFIAGGVSGILAAVFGTPLFAIAFVIEIVLHEKAIKDWAPVTISSLSAMLVSGGTSGYLGAYEKLLTNLNTNIKFEIVICLLMGICIGVFSALYTKGFEFMKRLCVKINKPFILAVIAGVGIAGIGYIFPEIFNAHTPIIANIISDYSEIYFLMGLFFAKLLVTVVSLNAGGVGGVFIPGLYMGATLGKTFGIIMILLNMTEMSSGVYAIIGMVTFFAGFSAAPLSATFLAVELTSDSRLLIPVLFVSLLSGAVYRIFCDKSIYGNLLSVENQLDESTKS